MKTARIQILEDDLETLSILLSKFGVPKEITEKKKARVEEERRKGQLNN